MKFDKSLLRTVLFALGVVSFVIGVSGGLTKIQDLLTGHPLNLSEDQIGSARQALTERLQSSASAIASGVITGVTAVGTALVGLFIVLFLVFFFVKDGPKFLPWLRGAVGERAGRHLDAVSRRCWLSLGGFIRSQAIVGLIDGVMIGVGLLILGVPLALPLAVLTFFGGFVPIVGALVAGALAILVALVTKGVTTALIVLAIVVAVQQIEGNVLQPILQGRALHLHEGVILLAVAAGGSLYGITGAFLAVPVVAMASVVFRYLSEQLDDKTGQARPREPEEPEKSGDGEQPTTPDSAPSGPSRSEE
ncbi:MAG: AI-2E family transporter [Hymenobacter sp.]